jgi:hypothetical protein
MSRCKKGCNTSELLPAFAASEAGRRSEEARVTAALKKLCEYAVEGNKLLCELGVEQMQGFVHHLYSLENEKYTPDDSREDIFIIMLFYDYLESRGCAEGNPVRELKAKAVQQLVERIKAAGFRVEEGDER